MNLYALLFRKRLAFRQVFDENKPEARVVLAELKRLCPQNPATGAGNPIDPIQLGIHIGRTQVLTHILGIIHLSNEKLEQIAREEKNYGN